MAEPNGNWFAVDYPATSWKEGPGGFGHVDGVIRTPWTSSEIWVRRTFKLEGDVPPRVALRIWHDEDAEVFLNGEALISLGGFVTGYESYEVDAKLLKTGENTLAIHCRQTNGGQYIDAGFEKLDESRQNQQTIAAPK